MAEETIAWFVGVDWGSEKHQVCLLDAQGIIIGERQFPHSRTSTTGPCGTSTAAATALAASPYS
jgi:hypothetical protein